MPKIISEKFEDGILVALVAVSIHDSLTLRTIPGEVDAGQSSFDQPGFRS